MVAGFAWSGCGHLYRVFVKVIPKPRSNERWEPDEVFEFNEKGEIIRRWSIPGNDIVYGIQGDRLLVSAPISPLFRSVQLERYSALNFFLAIAPDRQFNIVAMKNAPPETMQISCPNIKEFEGSAYTRCAVFKDLASGMARRLAYQGSCT
jgi:hypothetical protein